MLTKKKYIIIFIIIIIVGSLFLYIASKLNYKNKLDNSEYNKIIDLFNQHGYFSANFIMNSDEITQAAIRESMQYNLQGKDAIDWVDNKEKELLKKYDHNEGVVGKFNNELVKIDTKFVESFENNISISSLKYLIQTSKDEGKLWNVLHESDNNICSYGFIKDDKIMCVSLFSLQINEIDKNKEITKYDINYLNKPDIRDVLAVYYKDNIVTIVWKDGRARIPNFYSFYPLPNSADPEWGPYLIMAGELNLDNFEFKEHVIKYDSHVFP